MNKILYTQEDGTVAIVIPMDKYTVAKCLKVEQINIYMNLMNDFAKKYKSNPRVIDDTPLNKEMIQDYLILESLPKEKQLNFIIDKVFTEQEYIEHIYERSIPKDALKVREIEDTGIPSDREFRNAWVDVTPESKIDICCTKAKAWKLELMRAERNKKLKELDMQQLIALGKRNHDDLEAIETRKQALRDSTERLKKLDTTGLVNDEIMLNKIRELSKIED